MAIAALGVMAVVPVLTASARVSARANDPLHAALSTYAVSLARDAVQSWKYGQPSNLASQTYTTTLYGGAGAEPVTASVAETVAAIDATTSQVTVTVASGSESASANALLTVEAPLPGSQIARPGLVPMPSASPTP